MAEIKACHSHHLWLTYHPWVAGRWQNQWASLKGKGDFWKDTNILSYSRNLGLKLRTLYRFLKPKVIPLLSSCSLILKGYRWGVWTKQANTASFPSPSPQSPHLTSTQAAGLQLLPTEFPSKFPFAKIVLKLKKKKTKNWKPMESNHPKKTGAPSIVKCKLSVI